METMIPNRLTTLGHPQRLAVFRLLMRRYPDRVPASELAQALGLKASTLSTYVSALMQAGLISQARSGTSLRYTIDMAAARETIGFLVDDCCRGRPEICAPWTAASARPGTANAHRKHRVLFICTGNSARSVMAEAILRDLAPDRFETCSAGNRPKSAINPVALDVLMQHGHDVSDLRANHISEFQGANAPELDFIFTVCDQAANEECPAWQGQNISTHWGLPDPVAATGSDAEKRLAFHQTYSALRNRLTGFAALPIGALDRLSLQTAVDELGQIKE